jgi:hypothetical protein
MSVRCPPFSAKTLPRSCHLIGVPDMNFGQLSLGWQAGSSLVARLLAMRALWVWPGGGAYLAAWPDGEAVLTEWTAS